MRAIVYTLTFLSFACIAYQFFGKKGTNAHVLSGIFAFTFALSGVVVNTAAVSSERGLTWDVPFITHVTAGVLFFLSMSATIIFGFITLRRGWRTVKTMHRTVAHTSAAFLFLAVAAGISIPFFR